MMKKLARTLSLLTLTALMGLPALAALLAGCADAPADTADAGDRPRPTTAATTKAESEPPVDPDAPIWGQSVYDPWFDRETDEPSSLGQLYYRLDPSLAEGQSVDEKTKYVMSFTYVTADYHRDSLNDYLKDRGFSPHKPESDQYSSYITLYDLTEEEIKSITPESVQAYYQLDSAPAIVGLHRQKDSKNNVEHVNSEHYRYRVDLMWGVGYLSDDVKRKPDKVCFYAELEPNMAEARGWSADRKCAVTVCIDGISEGEQDYFASKGIQILPIQYADDRSTDYFGQQVVIEISLGDLWKITLEDMESFYGCDLTVTCFLAVQPNSAELIEAVE